MENLRITIETWGGNTSPENLADAIAVAIQQFSHFRVVNCRVEGTDGATASHASTILIREKNLKLEEARVNKYGELSIKYRP